MIAYRLPVDLLSEIIDRAAPAGVTPQLGLPGLAVVLALAAVAIVAFGLDTRRLDRQEA